MTYVKLSVNLSTEVGQALRDLSKRAGLNITDGVRRAVTVWKVVDEHLRSGGQIIMRSAGSEDRELVLHDGPEPVTA